MPTCGSAAALLGVCMRVSAAQGAAWPHQPAPGLLAAASRGMLPPTLRSRTCHARLPWRRMALQHGAPLVPVFAFGQTQQYSYCRLFLDWPRHVVSAAPGSVQGLHRAG